jgi:hypothetical protein
VTINIRRKISHVIYYSYVTFQLHLMQIWRVGTVEWQKKYNGMVSSKAPAGMPLEIVKSSLVSSCVKVEEQWSALLWICHEESNFILKILSVNLRLICDFTTVNLWKNMQCIQWLPWFLKSVFHLPLCLSNYTDGSSDLREKRNHCFSDFAVCAVTLNLSSQRTRV